MKLSDQQVIDVFKALSDPNRLQIFLLLLDSDRTNSELMDETGLRQNLLSHHLNIMTECGLIQTHRSIGDARRHYYSPRLEMTTACRQWWNDHSPREGVPLPALKQPRRVLFLCLRNGIRSYLAEALARHLAPDALIPESAGIEPVDSSDVGGLGLARRVMSENGVPAFEFEPKMYTAVVYQPFDYVVTVCDIVHEKEFPPNFANTTLVHWSLADPLEDTPDVSQQLAATREVYAYLRLRLAYFVQRLAQAEANAT